MNTLSAVMSYYCLAMLITTGSVFPSKSTATFLTIMNPDTQNWKENEPLSGKTYMWETATSASYLLPPL